MLSGFVKWAVKSYFGDFLEDVDCNKISLGMLKGCFYRSICVFLCILNAIIGHVELSNLKICKQSQLLSPKIPVLVEGG